MQLYHLFVRYSRSLVQAVDVLSDYARDASLCHELSDCSVTAVWFRFRDRLVDGDLPPPGLSTRFLRREEFAKVDWLVFCPNAAGTAEVRYSRFGADACAGEDDYPLARGN